MSLAYYTYDYIVRQTELYNVCVVHIVYTYIRKGYPKKKNFFFDVKFFLAKTAKTNGLFAVLFFAGLKFYETFYYEKF